MKQLNLYYVAGGGHTVPNGSTILPTDDVQILLKCADIWDKSYTTLSELFADSITLQAVINSTNAIDYLVRSKMFAGVGLVPTMTSDTTPSGECFGSSYRDSSYAYFKAFDNDSSTFWFPTSNATNNAIGYNFGTKTKVAKFRMVSRRITVHSDTFTVQGSDDNFVSDIHDLVSFTQEANSQGGDYDEIKSISGNYKSYRVFCPTVLYLASNYGVQTREIQFYSENICDNATAMSYIGLNNYASNTLLADETWCNAICNSTYFESVLNAKAPIMTSNTTPSGECFASSVYSGYPAWKAFNGGSGDWISANGQYANSYIGYGFTKNTKVYMARITQGHMSRAPKNYKLQAFDGTNWIDVTETLNPFNGTETPNTVFNQFTKNIGSYPRYRLFISTIQTTSENIASVRVLQFYGREDV